MTNEKEQYLMYSVLIRQIMRPSSASIYPQKRALHPIRSRHEVIFDATKRSFTSQKDILVSIKSPLKIDQMKTLKVEKHVLAELPKIVVQKPVTGGVSKPQRSFSTKVVSGTVVGALILASLALFALFVLPTVYYQFFSHDPVPVLAQTESSPLGGKFSDGAMKTPERRVPLPDYDETLPEGNWVIIPRIGVNTTILESADPEESLKNGVWRVPDFGNPGEESKPMILAAHRFGYKWWWQSQYWRYHSFYLLPELEPGDRIEVISGKRKYIYEIYAGEEAEDISDYNADLILYTCKYLNSPLRHFRYARLINPKTNTQASVSTGK